MALHSLAAAVSFLTLAMGQMYRWLPLGVPDSTTTFVMV